MGEHAGHRKRMFSRLAEGTLCDHEYLEMLLFYAIPRRNTNDIAHRLLARFGDLNGVLNAPLQALQEIDGVGENAASLLMLLGTICSQYRPYSIATGMWPVVYNRESFLAFVKGRYTELKLPYECVDVYLVDDNGRFYGCRRFGGQNLGKVLLSTDALGELLSRESPSALVLVHNHPSNLPKPSQKDDETTQCVLTLCNIHNVLLLDHVIFAETGLYSYFTSGRLKELSIKEENKR